MADAASEIEQSFLSLSAEDLRQLTDWPDALIEDYLSILRNLLTLANIVDVDVDGFISVADGKASFAVAALGELEKRVEELKAHVSANQANSLASTFGVFAAPPTIGISRMSPGFFTQSGIGTNRLRADIASTTPKAQVEGTDATATLSVVRNSDDALGANVYIGKTRGTATGATTIVQNNDVLGGLLFVAADGSDLDTVAASIVAKVDDSSPAAGSVGTEILISTMDTSGTLNLAYQITSGLAHGIDIGDNLASAFFIGQTGFNAYFQIVTTNGSEAINFGGTGTNPDFNFNGSGTLDVTGSYTSTNGSITLTNGALTVGGTLTAQGNIAMTGNLTSTNGNITLTNGDMTAGGAVVGGTLQDQSNILIRSGAALTDGAGAGAGTLTNAPTAGDPSKWVPIVDSGTTRYIPTWT